MSRDDEGEFGQDLEEETEEEDSAGGGPYITTQLLDRPGDSPW